MNTSSLRDEKGLAPRHLLLVFLAGVAVCGVFFSLGFLVGYNERSTRMSPMTEQVGEPAAIPPTVNAPPETVPLGSGGPTPATSIPPRVGSAPGNTPPASAPTAGTPSENAPEIMPAPAPSARADKEKETDAAFTSPTATAGAGAGFTVQVTAVRTRQDAEHVVKVLKGHGYPVFLVPPVHARGGDNLYRVQVGPFTSRDRAERMLAILKQQGFKPFIRR